MQTERDPGCHETPARLPAASERPGIGASQGRSSGPSVLLEALLLGALLLMLTLPAERWIALGATVPEGDSATHLLNTLYFQERLREASNPADLLAPALTSCDMNTYPPLVYQVTGLVGAWSGGLDLRRVLFLNLGWVALAVVSTYALGRRLFGGDCQDPRPGQGRAVGFAAALLLGFSPFVLSHLPTYLLDLPTMGVLALALASLAWAMDMRNRFQALLAGLAVGAALLTKWTTFFSLTPALLFVAIQVHRRCDEDDRAALGRLLAGVLVILTAAFSLALLGPPGYDAALQVLDTGDVHLWALGVAGGSLLALALGRRWLRSAPARNLVLAACVAMTVAGPFYLTHSSHLLDKVLVDLPEAGPRAAQESDNGFFGSAQMHLYFQAWGVPLQPLVLSGLLWLGLRGPRGGLALLGAPLLAHLTAHGVFCYFGARYYLPGFPLEILVATAWLVTLRPTRAVTLALVLSLGLWNAGAWWEGLPPYGDSWATPAGQAGNLGCGPESTSGRLARMTDRIARIAGPSPQIIGVQSWCQAVQPISVAALGAARGHGFLVQDLRGPGGSLDLRSPAICWDLRLTALRHPEVPGTDLALRASTPLHLHPEAWLLTLGRAPQRFRFPPELEGRLGPGQPLPSPTGCPATLYPVLRPARPWETARQTDRIAAGTRPADGRPPTPGPFIPSPPGHSSYQRFFRRGR